MNRCLKVLSLLFLVVLVCACDLRASDFTLKDLNQKSVTLSEFKDKQPVLLVFWTTWCPFCRVELNKLNSRYPELYKDNLEVMAVNVGETSQKVKNFTKSQNFLFSVLLDEDTQVASSYGLSGVPTYVLIDKKGQIIFQENRFPQDYKKLISE